MAADARGIRILLVDDDEHFVAGAAAVLRQAGYTLLTARGANEGAEHLSNNAVDLVLCDIHMQGNHDLAWAAQLAIDHPALPIVLVTGHPSVVSAARAVGLTVGAYLVKPVGPETLLAEVQRCLERVGIAGSVGQVAAAYARAWHLTRREQAVLEELTSGAANKEVASALGCSPRTVELHVSSILRKAGVDTCAELVATVLGVRRPQTPGTP